MTAELKLSGDYLLDAIGQLMEVPKRQHAVFRRHKEALAYLYEAYMAIQESHIEVTRLAVPFLAVR